MKVTAVKTHKITNKDKDLFKILDKYIPKLKEKSVVAVSSKIVAITEGRMFRIEEIDKDKLIEREAEYYLPRNENKYNVSYTITGNILVATAGIDESNADGHYVLWPSDPQESANKIRSYLKRVRGLGEVGVIITDSKTHPLRWGVTGIAIAHSGFEAVKDYIGKKDLFGRPFEFEKLNIMDSLASAAVLAMGEGSEQTPIAIIEDIPHIKFQDRNPTRKELSDLKISLEDDLFAPMLKSVKWKKGKRRR